MHKRNSKISTAVGLVVLSAIVFLVIWKGRAGLSESVGVIKRADLSFLLAAAACFGFTYLFGTFGYMLLLAKKMHLWPTLVVQLSGGLTNKIMPGGIGGAGLMAYYLKLRGFTTAKSAAAVSINALLGTIAAGLVLGIAIPIVLMNNTIEVKRPSMSGFLITVFFVILALLTAFGLSRRFRKFFKGYIGALKAFRKNRQGIYGDLVANVLITLFNGLTMWLVARSVGVNISFVSSLLAMYAGSLAGGLTPTPGGIGGSEAAIAGVLIAIGIVDEKAIAIAILFRLVTYWLPLLSGAVSFVVARKKHYI